ncbi:hypothetical protein [Peribacillus loiseleuriae]|uniref:Uncharacterized protein n=1 Tax=Peribacillus loiseleuriae TaxID=1679170 RepID=A0A0K9GSA5_9BACI|nr:hypothetical protein [Peribacillus loiseleuriae]KMY49569.1 hypothetical protein AC625_08440 [Peribacillus loiseleuriae]
MSLNALVINTLNPLGIPVDFQTARSNSPTYITFFFYNEKGTLYLDDDEKETRYSLQVDIWSKGDYISTVEQVKKLLKSVGFVRTFATDLYEKDTQIYHKVLRFSFTQDSD